MFLTEISAVYYSGMSSEAIPVKVRLDANALEIKADGYNSSFETITWNINYISPPDVTSSEYVYRYDGYPQQMLTIKKSDIMLLQKQYPGHKHLFRSTFFELSATPLLLAGMLIGGLCIILAVYFFVVPLISDSIANNLPESLEAEMGQTLKDNTLQQYTINDSLTVAVNDFCNKIDFGAQKLDITVVESNEVNAFAIPGGHIVVYSQIIAEMNKPEQLAALIGHEAGHVSKKHTLKSLVRSISGFVIISAAFGDVSGIIAVLAQNADGLRQLKYSRDLEAEADEVAFNTLEVNKINPRGIIELFEILQRESGAEDDNLSFMSTHPMVKERIAAAKANINTHKGEQYNTNLLEKEWKKILELK